MTYWQKNLGTPTQTLPFLDTGPGPAFLVYTDLANNPEGRTVCGWFEVAGPPAYDGATQQPVWQNGAWVIVELPPVTPSTIVSRDDFLRLFTLAERAAVAVSADPIVAAFRFELTIVSAVDLADANTIAAVDYMGSTTPPMLGTGRAAQILANAPPPAS